MLIKKLGKVSKCNNKDTVETKKERKNLSGFIRHLCLITESIQSMKHSKETNIFKNPDMLRLFQDKSKFLQDSYRENTKKPNIR